jgi:hypothetical protein
MTLVQCTHGRYQGDFLPAAAQPGDLFAKGSDGSGDNRLLGHQASVCRGDGGTERLAKPLLVGHEG